MKDFPENNELTITVPDQFMAFCTENMVNPMDVLCGFVGDLTGIVGVDMGTCFTNGSDERDLAEQYFLRCGYTFMISDQKEALINSLLASCASEMIAEAALPEEDRSFWKDDIETLVYECFEREYPGFYRYSDHNFIVSEVLERVKKVEVYERDF